MELSEADRTFLTEAEKVGFLTVTLVREGKTVPGAAEIRAHYDDMCRRGLVFLHGQGGTKARMQDARLFVTYAPTDVGLALLHAVEAREAAMALLHDARAALDQPDRLRQLLTGPRWRAVRKADRAAGG